MFKEKWEALVKRYGILGAFGFLLLAGSASAAIVYGLAVAVTATGEGKQAFDVAVDSTTNGDIADNGNIIENISIFTGGDYQIAVLNTSNLDTTDRQAYVEVKGMGAGLTKDYLDIQFDAAGPAYVCEAAGVSHYYKSFTPETVPAGTTTQTDIGFRLPILPDGSSYIGPFDLEFNVAYTKKC